MGFFSDVGQFFDSRLEEFLKAHPQLELQAIAEQLQEQEFEAQRLVQDLNQQLSLIQQEITQVAKNIQHWHQRCQQADTGNRPDLAAAAKTREAALLRQGNQLWGKMQGFKTRSTEAQALLNQLKHKRAEVIEKMKEIQASKGQSTEDDYTKAWANIGGDRGYGTPDQSDPLEEKFQQWEMEVEIHKMKQKMGR